MQNKQIESLSLVYSQLFEDAKRLISLIDDNVIEPVIFMYDNSLNIHWYSGKLPAVFIQLGIFNSNGLCKTEYSYDCEIDSRNSVGGSFNDIEEILYELVGVLNKHFKKKEC